MHGLLGPSNDDEKTSVEKIVSKADPRLTQVNALDIIIEGGIIMPAYRFLGYVVIAMGGFFLLAFVNIQVCICALFSFIGRRSLVFVCRQSGKRQQEFEPQMESVVAVMPRASGRVRRCTDIENASKELDEPGAGVCDGWREIGMG